MRTLVSLLVVLLMLPLAGCGEDSADEPAQQATEEPEATMTKSAQPAVVRDAIADLAQREGVEPSEVTVVSREEVTWRDGSLGCAEPGMSYTQALVDGSRITLSVAGKEYEYHSGGSGSPFLCERPTQ